MLVGYVSEKDMGWELGDWCWLRRETEREMGKEREIETGKEKEIEQKKEIEKETER